MFLGKLLELIKTTASANTKTTEHEIDVLRDEIKALRLDLDTWKEKYYSLLERVTVSQMKLTVLPEQTKVSVENVIS